MTYYDRRLQEAIYPYSLNPQMRAVLLPRFMDIESEYQKAVEKSQGSYRADDNYQSVEWVDVPTAVQADVTKLSELLAEVETLKTNIRAAGFNASCSVSQSMLRKRTEDEIRIAKDTREKERREISERHDTRMKSLQNVAKMMHEKVVTTVRLKIDANILTELDGI